MHFPFGFTNERPRSILHEKEVKAVVLSPETFETENKEVSKRKYNLVFRSPEALFDSHHFSILALKNKIQAVFIDEVQCVAKWLVFFLM